MSKIDLSSFKGLYFSTAHDYIKALSQNLEKLSESPTDQAAINAIYISAHSLTSQSHIMKNKNIGSLGSIIEKIFLDIKDGKKKASQDLLSLLKEAITGLENCIDSLERENKEIDLSNMSDKLKSI
jgi:two-component system, chemotaxis family, sensor kinase CheA